MDVNELLTDTRSEAEIEAEEKERLAKRKEKYKLTQRYFQTEDFEKLCKYFEEKADTKLKEIKEHLKNRKETKANKSEIDNLVQYTDFMEELIAKLGDSEAEQILKEELKVFKDNAESHILNKVEELFDAPVYTELDIIKQLRNNYALVRKRLLGISDNFLDEKDKPSNPNPYEKA